MHQVQFVEEVLEKEPAEQSVQLVAAISSENDPRETRQHFQVRSYKIMGILFVDKFLGEIIGTRGPREKEKGKL